MRRLNIAVLLIAACLTSGCATEYWYQKGKTFEECYADHRACCQELERLTDQTQLGDRELKIIEDCMRSRGYRVVPESRLPYPTKSLAPDRTIHYRLRGIAGAPATN